MDESRSNRHTRQRITSIQRWTANLWSFEISRPVDYDFQAGQFARLGLNRPGETRENTGTDTDSETVWRAFSMVSAPAQAQLEFYATLLPDGAFSSLLASSRVGDEILLDNACNGFLTLDRFAGGKDLWMLATGTGLGPFISMLREGSAWRDYRHLILVHSVRQANELGYRDELLAHAAQPKGEARLIYVPVVTRPETGTLRAPATPGSEGLHTRIPQLLAEGELERHVGVDLSPQASRLMLCGNPAMLRETRAVLAARGFASARRDRQGQIAVENYW